MRGAPFTQSSSGSASSGGTVVPSFITPTIVNTMGTTRTINLSSLPDGEFHGALDQTSCAMTFTGFTANKYSQIFCRISGSTGKNATFTDTFTSKTNGVLPVFSTSGVTEFTVFSEDGTNLEIAHGQQIRTIVWGPGNAATAVSSLSSPNFPIFNDARIVGGLMRLSTAGSVQSTIVDTNINGTTAFTTQANRPTIATNGTSSGNITLPDTVLLTPGQYISFDVDQFGTNAAGLLIALRLIEAA